MPTKRVYVPGGRPPVIGRCENCLYWKLVGRPQGREERSGECRRYPPLVHTVTEATGDPSVRTAFPETGPEEGCGEFANRSTSQTSVGDQSYQRTRMSDG